MRLLVLVSVVIVMFAVALSLSSAGQPGWNAQMSVYNENGEPVSLNVTTRPILLFAEWCPHCRAVLPLVAALPPDKRPVLVDTYYNGPPPTSKIESELMTAGMGGQPFYTVPSPPSSVSGVPVLISVRDGGAVIVSGEAGVKDWVRTTDIVRQKDPIIRSCETAENIR